MTDAAAPRVVRAHWAELANMRRWALGRADGADAVRLRRAMRGWAYTYARARGWRVRVTP